MIVPIGTVLTSSTKTTSFNCQSSSSFLSDSPSLRGAIRFCRSKITFQFNNKDLLHQAIYFNNASFSYNI